MSPSVTDVEAIDGYRLVVQFSSGERGGLDMKPYLDFGVFVRIRDPEVFKSVHVCFDTLEWTGGIDLDPEFVYEKCMKERISVTA